jgi:uncharacterized protein (TIGR03083 family)
MPVDDSEVAELDPFDLLRAENQRLESFFRNLGTDEWRRPTRCEGWTIRDVLAHLAGNEEYNRACLDDDLQGLFQRAGEAGVTDVDSYNHWSVKKRADQPVGQVLEEWSTAQINFRQELCERGRDGTIATMVGPYPAGFQAFHLASEAATHADDVGAPVSEEEQVGRTKWRTRVSRFALSEKDNPVTVETDDDGNTVRFDDQEAVLTDEELVEAVVGRLPQGHPLPDKLRSALRVLA